jgi:hypothetical protein
MFDPDKFHEQLIRNLEVAEGVKTPKDVLAKPFVQAGQEVLVGTCPNCSTRAALSAEGKHLCHGCNQWLQYRRA